LAVMGSRRRLSMLSYLSFPTQAGRSY
jgi:hypothetical protein